MGTQSLLDLADKRGEVGVGGGQEVTSQEHLARQTIAEAPQDFLAHIGLEAIEGEYDTPCGCGGGAAAVPCLGASARRVRHSAPRDWCPSGRDRHTTLDQRLMERWHTGVGGIARANAGEDIEATRVLGRQAPFRFGPVRSAPEDTPD